MQFKVLKVLYFYKYQKLKIHNPCRICCWLRKWDTFEIDKPVVLSSRGEELKNLTFYDKSNIQKIMFTLKLRLMNFSQSKSVRFWDTYVETISKRNDIYISIRNNSQSSISILEKISTASYILYYTKISIMKINV